MEKEVGVVKIKHFTFSDMKTVEFCVPLIYWNEFEKSKEFQELQRYLYDLGKRHNKKKMKNELKTKRPNC